jgi:hypothetical protein
MIMRLPTGAPAQHGAKCVKAKVKANRKGKGKGTGIRCGKGKWKCKGKRYITSKGT